MAHRKSKTRKKNVVAVSKVEDKAAEQSQTEVVADQNTDHDDDVYNIRYPRWTTWVYEKSGPLGSIGLWALLMVAIWPTVLSVGSAAISLISIRVVGGFPQLVVSEMGPTAPTMMPIIFLTVFVAFVVAWLTIRLLRALYHWSKYMAKALFWDRDRHARKERAMKRRQDRKEVGKQIKARKQHDKDAKIKARQQVAEAKAQNPEL